MLKQDSETNGYSSDWASYNDLVLLGYRGSICRHVALPYLRKAIHFHTPRKMQAVFKKNCRYLCFHVKFSGPRIQHHLGYSHPPKIFYYILIPFNCLRFMADTHLGLLRRYCAHILLCHKVTIWAKQDINGDPFVFRLLYYVGSSFFNRFFFSSWTGVRGFTPLHLILTRQNWKLCSNKATTPKTPIPCQALTPWPRAMEFLAFTACSSCSIESQPSFASRGAYSEQN